MRFIDRAEVRERLTYEICIPLIRAAMMSLSAAQTFQLPRSILPLADGNQFGIMSGALGKEGVFGAKLVSVFPGNSVKREQSHQGVVVLFDSATGAPICIAHAGEITAIRTAAASAVATDALARPDATHLAILGYGEQGAAHARAINQVRELSMITIWGRSHARALDYAQRMSAELGVPVQACEDACSAVAEADIICTVTASPAPILHGRGVRPGTHVNVVGSSYAGPAEVDSDLVIASRFVADSRVNVLAQGAEFLIAKAAGRVTDAHIVGEIGQVLLGSLVGRQSDDQITLYKSLGHIVQDLVAAGALVDAGGKM